MRRTLVIGLCLVVSTSLTAMAQTAGYMPFEFDGQKVMGRPVQHKDTHVMIVLQGGGVTNVAWGRLSQSTLQELARVNRFYNAFATNYIDLPPLNPPQGPRITIKPVQRMERPTSGGLFASPVMYLVFFLVYLANIYAAYEIAIYRQRNTGMVCGLAALAPVIVPAIFLVLPSPIAQQMAEEAPAEEAPAEGEVAEAPPTEEAAPVEEVAPAEAAPAEAATVYRRGQFTFNRRFFETKLAGFLRVVPGPAEKDMLLTVIATRGTYVGPRIARVSPNDLTLHVVKGGASQDVAIPFTEINEVKIQHKDAA